MDHDTSTKAPPVPPDPDDARKPESPTDLTKPSRFYVLRKTAHEFTKDQCTDLAAALTYYAVLSVFPGPARDGVAAGRVRSGPAHH